jgi:phage terminase large subunit
MGTIEVRFTECNPNHAELFQSTAPELIVYGGSGAGKSYSVADKLLMRSIFEPNTRYLIIRKTLPSLKDSCMEYFETRSSVHGVPYEYHEKSGKDTQ